jgi:hypothetical protein
MAERVRKYDKPQKEFKGQTIAEQLERKKRQKVRQETEATHDGRPKTFVGLDEFDPLLDALIKEHPEKDPAKIK